MNEKQIHHFSEDVEKCILCGACQAVCPVYAERLDEKQVARGRMALLKSVLAGELPLTDELNEIVATCIGCKACSDQCPSGAEADLANLAAKISLAGEKGLPFYRKILARQVFSKPEVLSASSRLLHAIGTRVYTPLAGVPFIRPALPFIRNGAPRNIPPLGRPSFHERAHENRLETEPRGRVALFYGCAIDQIYPGWGDAAVRILNRSGFEVTIPKEQVCCGAPVIFMGDRISAERMVEANLQAFDLDHLDAVITLCATCGSTLKELYPKLFGMKKAKEFSAKVMDLHEFLVTHPLAFENAHINRDSKPLKVTYHDPCHLKRGMGVHKEPREILESLPDIQFVEMNDADRCCGGGGLFSMSHYDLALKIGKHKVERIHESGAEIVATACPSCMIHLTDLLKREGLNIPVVHVCELLNRSQEKPESQDPLISGAKKS
jgi:glycolate oxidase iron-sulfur subunit